MSHPWPSEETRELASLYALGALDGQEQAAFEAHLAEGCGACRAEVAGLAGVAALLGLAVEPVAPPPALRQRLLARAGRPAAEALTISRAREASFEATGLPGVSVRWLARESGTQRDNHPREASRLIWGGTQCGAGRDHPLITTIRNATAAHPRSGVPGRRPIPSSRAI